MNSHFDYDLQCYVENGIIAKCAHKPDYPHRDKCEACVHGGKSAAAVRALLGFAGDQWQEPISDDPREQRRADGSLPIFDWLTPIVGNGQLRHFMFMGLHEDIAAFKHRETRNYIHVNQFGATFQYDYAGSKGGMLSCYRWISQAEALRRAMPPAPAKPRPVRDFNEADCGGVFDGFGVISDADNGL